MEIGTHLKTVKITANIFAVYRNLVLIDIFTGFYKRAVTDEEQVIMGRVRYLDIIINFF